MTDRPAAGAPTGEPGPVKASRLADQVHDWLKEQVLTQRLLPGQRLSVPAIAHELEISRSPVREAVQRLVQEGLCTERPHQGAEVARADLPSLVDLYVVRAVLEGLSAELAAQAGDETLTEDLLEIHATHQAAYDTGRHADVIRADMEFHRRILQAAGNDELVRVTEPIVQRMYLAILAGEQHWPSRALDEHRAVIDALRERNGSRAKSAMVRHIHRVRRDLMAKAGDEPDPHRRRP